MTQLVIHGFVKGAFTPKNLKVLTFNVLKSSKVFITMNTSSMGTSYAVYTTVTAMKKIRISVAEMLRQLGGKKFRHFLFKRVAAAHADHKEVDAIFESLVLISEEYCEGK